MQQKFVKVSVPLERREYDRLHYCTLRLGANHAAFIRIALKEKLDRMLVDVYLDKPPRIQD